MDSSVISPGQNPALAGLETRLLPLLTEHMARLRLEIERIRGQGAATAEGLDELTEAIDQLGWCLGLTCAATGADILMERSRADGLALLLNLVLELRGQPPATAAVPPLRPDCPWDLPFVVAQLMWWGSPGGVQPAVEKVGESWRLSGPWIPEASLLPSCPWSQASLTLRMNGTWRLDVPGTWMHP